MAVAMHFAGCTCWMASVSAGTAVPLYCCQAVPPAAPEASRQLLPSSSTQVSGTEHSTVKGGCARPRAPAAVPASPGGRSGLGARPLLLLVARGRIRMEAWVAIGWSASSRAAERMRSRPALQTHHITQHASQHSAAQRGKAFLVLRWRRNRAPARQIERKPCLPSVPPVLGGTHGL